MNESAIKKKVTDAWKELGGLTLNISERFSSGIPDTYLADNGCSVWIEFKVDHNKPSKLQKVVLEKFERTGIPACVVTYTNKTKLYKIETMCRGCLCENITINDLIFALRELSRRRTL